MRRRDFLSCAALAAACTAVPSLAFSQEKTFKTVLKKADIADPGNFAYMEELKKMGYDGVETWVYSDKTLLGIHTEETRRERGTCTPLFIAALFI